MSYHPLFSPSLVGSSKPFATHVHKYKAQSNRGSVVEEGLARVPSSWGTTQVRRAIKEKVPDAVFVDCSWAPFAEAAGHEVNHDFSK